MAKRRSFLLILLLSAVLLSGLTSLSVYAQISSFSSGQSAAEYRTENYSNGDQYTGYFVNGLYNGEGTYVWANGDRYEGEFMNGQIDGAGRLTFFGNGQYWEGLFIQGKINNGSGIFYWGSNGDKFDGQWLNGQPEGTGILLHTNGTSEKVTFSNGKITGQIGGTAGGNEYPYSGGSNSYAFNNIKVGDVVNFGR